MKNKIEILKDFKKYLQKDVNWWLLIVIFLFQFLPTIYKTTRVYFLGTLPDENSFNIASNILWLNIFYEIITESIVIPLFFVFNKWFKNKKENIGGVFSILTLIIFEK